MPAKVNLASAMAVARFFFYDARHMTKPDHQLPKPRSGEPRAFFGRRSGKKLHGGQQAVFDATPFAVVFPLLQAATWGLAYRAKPAARAAADGWIDRGDLTAVLDLLGIPRDEWVAA